MLMVWFSFFHCTSLCISCDKNLEEFFMLCSMLWTSYFGFLLIKIYVCTWLDLLFVNKALKPPWLVGKTRSLKASLNIYLMIHGLDIFLPIISKLVCELTLNPLLLFHHVVHTFWIKVKTPMVDLTIPCGRKM